MKKFKKSRRFSPPHSYPHHKKDFPLIRWATIDPTHPNVVGAKTIDILKFHFILLIIFFQRAPTTRPPVFLPGGIPIEQNEMKIPSYAAPEVEVFSPAVNRHPRDGPLPKDINSNLLDGQSKDANIIKQRWRGEFSQMTERAPDSIEQSLITSAVKERFQVMDFCLRNKVKFLPKM